MRFGELRNCYYEELFVWGVSVHCSRYLTRSLATAGSWARGRNKRKIDPHSQHARTKHFYHKHISERIALAQTEIAASGSDYEKDTSMWTNNTTALERTETKEAALQREPPQTWAGKKSTHNLDQKKRETSLCPRPAAEESRVETNKTQLLFTRVLELRATAS